MTQYAGASVSDGKAIACLFSGAGIVFGEPMLGTLIEPLTGRRWDRPAIMEAVARRATLLACQGLSRGDRVFIHYGNNLEFFTDLLAIWWLGGCVVPIDPRLTPFEVETLAQAARPRFSLLENGAPGELCARLSGADIKLVSLEAQLESGSDALPASPLRLDDAALIVFTSGTTGEPKGIVHSHRSLRARWTALRQALGLNAYRRALCLLPTGFVHGLVSNSLFPWLHGADLYVLPPFRADTVAQLGAIIDEHDITFLSSVPSLWTMALRLSKPPQRQSLKRVHCASAPLSKEIWIGVQEWARIKDVFNSYGLTETASWSAGIAAPVPEDGLVGEGWGAEIKILKSNSADLLIALAETCAPGEQGHVWISTPSLMTGYLGREELTARAVSQCWLSTGDIGLIDERGLLYLRGREREEINKAGMKIYPGDIDSVASQFQEVSDACAFAVDDPVYGQDVGIALVIKEPSDEVLAKLRFSMSARLAKHQMPAYWFLLDSIPRTSRGKVNRERVASRCSGLKCHVFRSGDRSQSRAGS